MNLFKSKHKKKLEQLEKAISEGRITSSQDVARILQNLNSTLPLRRDSNMDKYVKEGFEGNSDVFGILMTLATKSAQIPIKIYKVQKNGKEIEQPNHEFAQLLRKPNFYQSQMEFRMAWHLFKYTTGDVMVRAARYSRGMSQGRIDKAGMMLLPPQNIEIIAKGNNPLGIYRAFINEQFDIAGENVWHERFPSLTYEDGRNFRGTSPLKVAMNIINLQNAGQEQAAKLLKGGFPPGIVSFDEMQSGLTSTQEQQWRSKYKSKYQKDISIPIFTAGKVDFTQIGYSNLKDLQVLEMDENGTKKLCRTLSVPGMLFGVGETTYNNMLMAEKAMYQNRVLPDVQQFVDGLNTFLPAYGDGLIAKADTSGIEALQADREKMVNVLEKAIRNGMASPNDGAEALGFERSDDPGMDDRYIQSGLIPISMSSGEMPVDENNAEYNRRGLENGM
ncbi:MAG: phage portal protein [Bacteroidales bacterium]|nr:phage portal protein [Bacteroidales bacterium]